MFRLKRLGKILTYVLFLIAVLASQAGAPRAQDGETAEEVFHNHISGPIVQSKCVNCHVQGGPSGHTRLVFTRRSAEAEMDYERLNLQAFESFLTEFDEEGGGGAYILLKIQGALGHGGREQVRPGSTDFANMQRFLALLGEELAPPPSLTVETLFDTVVLAADWKTLRRSALIFAGRIPTEAEYAAIESGRESDLRAAIRGLMEGPEFHEFLIRGSNDRLLTDRNAGPIIDDNFPHFTDFSDEAYRLKEAAHASGDRSELNEWMQATQFGFRRAPLELIAYVVENDRPYTEILTADYIMANPWAARAYGASTRFRDRADPHEFRPSRIVSYYRWDEDLRREFDPVVGATRVVNPEALIPTSYPHAGILNTPSFLNRYPTTATNRNRARSRWTYYHFLGLDVEKSASRTTDPVALADTNNPTMHNPACTVCHTLMDPVAGAFQYYSDDGYYKHALGGLDSLDDLYKEAGGDPLAVQAESWAQRETLAWTVRLAEGVGTVRVLYSNHFWDEAAREGGRVFLDRLDVVDASGRTVVSKEFETLPSPVAHWGDCGGARYNEATRRHDHFGLWSGGVACAFYIDVDIPSGGDYDVEVVAWSHGYDDRYGGDGYAELSVAANVYEHGDTWYRDMRLPGFNGAAADPANSVQWLARRIVADDRFAEAAVRFWWPAVMGSEIAEFPEEAADADFEGRLLAASAQDAEVLRLADGFRDGFHGGPDYNLRDLLVEIVLSEWFRADAVTDADPVRREALRDAGAERLLTPEELARKTLALTGVQWGRDIATTCWPLCRRRPNRLTRDYRVLYGGIDSSGITQRGRDITTVMAGVAKRHAAQVGCAVVGRELYLLPDAERRLFAGIDPRVTAAGAVKDKLVELHDKLLGVRVAADSPDVAAKYRLFVNAMEIVRSEGSDWFDIWSCEFWQDIFFFEGILDNVIEEKRNSDGYRYYGMNDQRRDDYLRRIDLSDPHRAAQAWVVVLTAMLMDYRYLYL